MKCAILLFIALLLPLALPAQQREDFPTQQTDIVKITTDSAETMAPLVLPIRTNAFPSLLTGFGLCGISPWASVNDMGWGLHEGFNAQVGMSLGTAWGKYAPKGVAFGQNLSMAYARPLNRRFAVAVGLYANNLDWGGYTRREVGLSGVLRYRANEWLDLYAYGTKNFATYHDGRQTRARYHFPYLDPDSRVGMAAEFKLSEKVSLGVSMEWVKYEDVEMPHPFFRPSPAKSPLW